MSATPSPSHAGSASVTLFGRDSCPGAAELRALFDAFGVPFSEVPLDQPHTPGDVCGFTSPSVQITVGARKPEFLVQPSRDRVVAALQAAGQLPGARRMARPAAP